MDRPNKSHQKTYVNRKSSIHCCIPNCNNSRIKDLQEKTKHSYFRFPKKDTKQYKLWLQNNRLKKGKNFQPRKWERICSSHFEGGKFFFLCVFLCFQILVLIFVIA